MFPLRAAVGVACASLIAVAQIPEVRPQIAGRAVQEGQVTVVYLAPRFAIAIRMPDAINSVVLGDPASFAAEHSEREPQIVFLKPITDKAAQTNLLISTTHGSQASLLLISQGEAQKEQPNVDFEMRCRPAGRFIIDPSSPSVLAYGGVGHRIYHGSPWIRHFAAAGMALVLSGLLRLAEFFVQRGVGGIR